MFTIASHLVRNHDLAAGIMVLQEIQEMYPRDPILLSCIGRIQLQVIYPVHVLPFAFYVWRQVTHL